VLSIPPIFVVGVLLGWATFLLGGTIGSLGGISIGFTGIAVVIERVHRIFVGSMSRSGVPQAGRSRLATGRR